MDDYSGLPETAGEINLFDRINFPGDAFCELHHPDGSLRSNYQQLITSFNSSGSHTLEQYRKKVLKRRHEDGATFNPFENKSKEETSWSLDILPQVIPADEWRTLEKGLIQRAQLLEKILADSYGPQQLLSSRVVPPEIFFANPNFLRSCHGASPIGNRFLPFLAVDVYKDQQGNYRVYRDHAASPKGMGYALENRIVLSRVLSGLYRELQVNRLAPFFQRMQAATLARAGKQQEELGVVILSPGPASQYYFEHSLLSRYLGYPLVESQDLTVRNGKVFLKKLAGLEPVEVIFRHIDDRSSDPFALRTETNQGVAGLLQAARERSVEIINPLGSGLVDTPVLSHFLNDICRYFFGSDLLLPDHSSWWCGNESEREYVLGRMNDLIIRQAMAPSDRIPSQLSQAIQQFPHRFMAEERIKPSVVPQFTKYGMVSSYTLLRLFLCATSDGYTVMPGGLAIISNDIGTLLSNNSENQHTKDIWVLSDQPVEPVSLLAGMETVVSFDRSSDLPSRVADNLLWLGRYLERAEARIRLLRSIYKRLSSEARPEEIVELKFLVKLLKSQRILLFKEKRDMLPLRDLHIALHEVMFNRTSQSNVYSTLKSVQYTARNVRDRLSMDCWRVVNRLELFFEGETADPLDLLEETLFSLSCFSGVAMESMTRGLGWRFMDLGRRIERGINQGELLLAGISSPHISSRESMEALLEIADSLMTYRSRYRTKLQLSPVLDLLLCDESNPKSVAFQLSQIAQHVEKLPRESERRYETVEEQLTLELLTSNRLLNLRDIDLHLGENGQGGELAEYLESSIGKLKEFAQSIGSHYLSRVPSTPHFSTLSGEMKP